MREWVGEDRGGGGGEHRHRAGGPKLQGRERLAVAGDLETGSTKLCVYLGHLPAFSFYLFLSKSPILLLHHLPFWLSLRYLQPYLVVGFGSN